MATKKPTKVEESFEFNEETINFFTKDLDPRQILVKHYKNSLVLEKLNDSILICLLLKSGHIKDYHCCTKTCKVGKIWNGQPIQLILNRLNNNQNDLTIGNLELICANCYMVKNGLNIFIKKKKEAIFVCSLCNFPLVKFKDSRKKKGLCLSCEKQTSKISFEKQEESFYNRLKETYNDNPILSDDIKHTNYYSEVSKYKNFDNTKSMQNQQQNQQQLQQQQKPPQPQQQPIIELNMKLPDLSDLIDEIDEVDAVVSANEVDSTD